MIARIATHRPARLGPAPRPGAASAPAPRATSARALWGFCVGVGFAFGLVESLLRLSWPLLGAGGGGPDLWVNRNAPWMAPASLAVFLLGIGAAAGLARGIAPRTVAWLLPRGLIALGAWSALGAVVGLHPGAAALLAAGAGVRLGAHVRPASAGFGRLVRRAGPVAALLWLVLLVGTGLIPAASEWWGLAFGPEPPAGAPNVLLVVLDTVRADDLSLHGYGRPTSPRLEARARRGVRFEQARATTPYTLGTHASLFTGHWMSRTSARVDTPLDGRHRTLAEHLRDRGYATGGFVGNIFYGNAHYGLGRGFLRYLDIPGDVTRRVTPREFLRSCRLGESLVTWFERKWRILAPMQRLRLDAAEVNREALAWVDANRSRGRPYFLFLNYFDAHSPYSLPGEAPQPFSRLTADRVEARLERLQGLEAGQARRPTRAGAAEVRAAQAEAWSHVRDAYDDGIAWIDRQLDGLLGELDRRGLLADTLVVITSDHGEMLGEHGQLGHGDSLRRPVVHVPLVVLGARGMAVPEGVVVRGPASVRDVPATILDLLGDPEAGRFPGRSLRRRWSGVGGEEADAAPVVSEMEHLSWRPRDDRKPAASGPLWLVTEGRWSYHRQAHESRGVIEALYDLEVDPSEGRDLASEPSHRRVLEALRARLDRELAGAAGGGTPVTAAGRR